MLVSRKHPKPQKVDVSSPLASASGPSRVIQPIVSSPAPVEEEPVRVILPGDSAADAIEEVDEVEEVREVEHVDDSDTDPEADDDGPAAPIPAVALREVNAEAERVARDAVARVLADQAEARLFDVVDSNRIVLTLQPDDITILRAQWSERNSSGLEKITFSEFLSLRLRSCRAHSAARAIYVRDVQRRTLEELSGTVLMTDDDLVHMVDRHIRPIIEDPENPDGILRLEPLDPLILELVPSWYPDKTPTKAISDFLYEAGREKAGII